MNSKTKLTIVNDKDDDRRLIRIDIELKEDLKKGYHRFDIADCISLRDVECGLTYLDLVPEVKKKKPACAKEADAL